MSTQKIGDLAVKVGSYQKDGQSKGRYEAIGTLFQGDDGGQFITLKPWVDMPTLLQIQRTNARSEGKEPRDMLMVSVFTEDGRPQQQTAQAGRKSEEFSDDIPF